MLLAFVMQVIAQAPKSRGALMFPHASEISQPDGSIIVLKGNGDGVVNWLSTEQGYTVLKTESGWYEYAVQSSKGELVLSGISVTSSQNSTQELEFFNQHNIDLRYSKTQIETKKKSYHADGTSKSGAKAFPTTGKRKVLLVLASFSDKANQLASSVFNNVMNQENYNTTGSFRDFYLASSYDKLDLTTTVTVWVQVSNTHAYYGGNDASGYDQRPREFVREAVDSLEAQGFDFSPFDNDNDGYVDGIQVIHAGYGEEYGGADENNIWSHRWSLGSQQVTYDGVTIYDYAIYPELRGTSGTNPSNIGVICHEFGHSLGLPDYYDTDYGESGGQSFDLETWDMMSGGSWNNSGAKPANHNAYSKSMMGWLTLEELTGPVQGKTLNNAMENAEACIFHTSTSNEFFVLENRQKVGFDSYIPHHGMLIFHVDKNHYGWSSNDINVDPDHQGMDIEEADNTQNSYSMSGDVFPGSSNVTSFTDETSPGSLAWDGSLTAKPITNISESGNVITFDFMFNDDVNTPSSFNASVTGETQVTLSWEQDQNKNDILLAFSTTNSFGTPVNGTTYTAGQTISGGGQVLIADSTEQFIHTGLTQGTTYYYQIWSNNGTEYSSAASTSIQVLPPDEYQITLQVVDTLDQPIENALVDLGSAGSAYTNSEGVCTFTGVNGVYNYTISKNTFHAINGSLVVNDGNYTEKITIKSIRYWANFTVVDEANKPINNAEISIDGEISTYTNSEGKASISLFSGKYNYTIALDAYNTKRGELLISGNNESITDTLILTKYNAKFEVQDSDGNSIEDAQISINDEFTEMTDALGESTFRLVPGTHSYTISKVGYATNSGNFRIIDTNIVVNSIMSLTDYDLMVKVVNKDNNIIPNVSVALNDVGTVITDDSGESKFSALTPNTMYYYSAFILNYGSAADSVYLVSDTTVTLQIIPVGVSINQQTSYIVYPNPNKGIFYIKGAQGADVMIYDAIGRLVIKQELKTNNHRINLEAKTAGEYHVVIQINEQRETHTLIVE